MSPNNLSSAIKPIILAPATTKLTADEKALFAELKPAGLIFFQRNCVSKSQLSELILEFKEITGNDNAEFLIDQEGGTVARLKAPEWREYPAAIKFAKLAEKDIELAKKAIFLNYALMGCELVELGITVNCAPVVDVPSRYCHEFLSKSRVYGKDASMVSELASEVCKALLNVGISPTIKHIPGHGRAKVDSHKELPIVKASIDELENIDFLPFKNIANSKIGGAIWAMGAHIIYDLIDRENPATNSKYITDKIIREKIGFNGVLIADDIGMQALSGSMEQRAIKTIQAGYDLTLHCSGNFDEMRKILANIDNICDISIKNLDISRKMRLSNIKNINNILGDMSFEEAYEFIENNLR